MGPQKMPYPNGNDQMTEAHEERIQRLETSMNQVAATTAAAAVKLDNLVDKCVEGFEKINNRLDRGAAQFDQHESMLNEQRLEISKIKENEAARAARWTTAKKAIIPLVAAAATVIASKFGESIWAWLKSIV